MATRPLVIALPIADRRTSFAFYRDGLGLVPVGEAAEDGVPEPLRFALGEDVHLMFVPTGGFGWVIGDREVCPRTSSECVLTLSAETETEVDALIESARGAGAEIVATPEKQPWGYTGTFADPDGHLWMVSADARPS